MRKEIEIMSLAKKVFGLCDTKTHCAAFEDPDNEGMSLCYCGESYAIGLVEQYPEIVTGERNRITYNLETKEVKFEGKVVGDLESEPS